MSTLNGPWARLILTVAHQDDSHREDQTKNTRYPDPRGFGFWVLGLGFRL